MAIINASNLYRNLTSANNGDQFEIGPASTAAFVGTWLMQFDPSVDFLGTIQILGRITGPAVTAGTAPLVPIPYRRLSLGGASSDGILVADLISTTAIIQIASCGLSVAYMPSISQGNCKVFCWSQQGPSTV